MPLAQGLNQAATRWFTFGAGAPVNKLVYSKPSFPVVDHAHELSRDLQLCCPIYEGFGNILNDVRYTRTGVFNGGVAFTANRGSRALTFDGVGDYVEYANSNELNITGNKISIACGFRFSTSQNNRPFLSKWGVSTQYILLISNALANKITFAVNAGGTTATITSANTYNDGEIHNAVGVYDGVNLYLYIDGVSVATPVAKTGNITSTTDPVILGRYSSATGDYTGELNYAYVWSRALSFLEVELLHFDPYLFLRGPLFTQFFIAPITIIAPPLPPTPPVVNVELDPSYIRQYLQDPLTIAMAVLVTSGNITLGTATADTDYIRRYLQD